MADANRDLSDDWLETNESLEIQLTGPNADPIRDFGYNAAEYSVTTVICFDYQRYSQCHRLNQGPFDTYVDSFKNNYLSRTDDDWLAIWDAGRGRDNNAGIYTNMGYFIISSWNKLYERDYSTHANDIWATNDGRGYVKVAIGRRVGRYLTNSDQCYLDHHSRYQCSWDEADDYVEGQGKL